MCAERPTVLVVPRSVKVVMISTLQCLSSVHSLWHQRQHCKQLLAICFQYQLMTRAEDDSQEAEVPIPLILCRFQRHTVSVPVRQTSNVPTAAWTRVPFSLFHTLQSSAAVHWSARTAVRQGNETMHAARRPTARPLYQGRCISYDIAIWNATIYQLAY